MNPIIVIPSRMGSTRLPGKPLAMIAGEPLIVHVWRRAIETEQGPVVVACDHPSVAEAILAVGGRAVMTRPGHPSSTDRIAEALSVVDPYGRHGVVINFQGNLPTVALSVVRETVALLGRPEVALATPVALITDPHERLAANVVKMVGTPLDERRFRALYFTRVQASWGEGPFYHHIGLYAWRRGAFEQFVAMPPTTLERREKLEQLRALEAGMRVDAVLVDDVPLGVDTPEDLAEACAMIDPSSAALQ